MRVRRRQPPRLETGITGMETAFDRHHRTGQRSATFHGTACVYARAHRKADIHLIL